MIFDSPQAPGWAHPLARAETSGVGRRRRGYDPNQPRVPKGHPDGGEWTDDDRWIGVQFAAAERPPMGPRGSYAIALEIARRLIDVFRRENGQLELFGDRRGAVTVTTIDGRQIYGSNPDLGAWRSIDRTEADRLRAIIVQKHPELADPDNIDVSHSTHSTMRRQMCSCVRRGNMEGPSRVGPLKSSAIDLCATTARKSCLTSVWSLEIPR
jgi:hypothetical protein